MAWKDFENFVGEKFKEYKAEIKDAKALQDSQKEFFEGYISKEKQFMMELEGILKNGTSGASSEEDSGGSPNGTYSGTIQEKFWQYFRAAGFSKESVAGMMGNIQRESSFQPKAIEASGGGGFGLIQWTAERRTAIEAQAKKEGKDVNDVDFQFSYLLKELSGLGGNWMENNTQGHGRRPFAQFKTGTDIKWATEAFCWAFERPDVKDAAMPFRIEWANKYYAQFKDFKPSSGGGLSKGGKLRNPCSGVVTSKYGYRTDPITGEQKLHAGTDIGGSGPITAAADGKVILNSFDPPGYGYYVIMDHGTIGGKNIKTLYGHMAQNSVKVKVGQQLKAGDFIGTMGSTGGSTGVHLHFEVKINDTHLDSRPYIDFKDA